MSPNQHSDVHSLRVRAYTGSLDPRTPKYVGNPDMLHPRHDPPGAEVLVAVTDSGQIAACAGIVLLSAAGVLQAAGISDAGILSLPERSLYVFRVASTGGGVYPRMHLHIARLAAMYRAPVTLACVTGGAMRPFCQKLGMEEGKPSKKLVTVFEGEAWVQLASDPETHVARIAAFCGGKAMEGFPLPRWTTELVAL